MIFKLKQVVFGLTVVLVGLGAQSTFSQQVTFSMLKAKFGAETARTITVPYTENVEQEYRVSVPVTETVSQTYQIQVPYTENVEQTYTVQVPYTETLTGDDGKKKEVQKMRTETRTRLVPVQRIRTETRTRKVPVTKVKTETKTRMVPVRRVRTETRTSTFPPADAKFAYASGEEISIEQLKKVAAEEVAILSLPPGQTLTKLYKSILKPDLIVMTLPKKEKASKTVEDSAEEAPEESGKAQISDKL